MRLDGPGDTAGRVFGAAALGIIEGFSMIVEVFFSPGRFELPFAGPLDAVPAVSVIGRGWGHEEVLAYQEPDRAANPASERSRRPTESKCGDPTVGFPAWPLDYYLARVNSLLTGNTSNRNNFRYTAGINFTFGAQ